MFQFLIFRFLPLRNLYKSSGSLKSKCWSTSCTVPPVFWKRWMRKEAKRDFEVFFHSSECVQGGLRIGQTDAGQSWHFSVWPTLWFRATLTAMFLWWGLSVRFSSSQLFLTIDPVLRAHPWSSTCFQSHSCLRCELTWSLGPGATMRMWTTIFNGAEREGAGDESLIDTSTWTH